MDIVVAGSSGDLPLKISTGFFLMYASPSTSVKLSS